MSAEDFLVWWLAHFAQSGYTVRMTFEEILQLIQLGLAVFTQVWGTTHGVPPAPTPANIAVIQEHLLSTPGLTNVHKVVIKSALAAVVKASQVESVFQTPLAKAA